MNHPLRFLLALSLAAGAALPSHAALPTPDADNGGITLPQGFRALVVADDLMTGRKTAKSNDYLRFLAIAPNGDLYGKTFRGGIFALRDNDGDGRYEEKHEFGEGGGTGIAFHNGWLYHSTNSAVLRYKYTPGELVPSGQPETIVTGLPDRRTHEAKCFAFDDQGRLLVEVGSPANAFSNGDRQRGASAKTKEEVDEFLRSHGGFWRFDPDKNNQTQADAFHFSTGHRHSLAIAWQPTAKAFYMVQMGRDQMNVVAPEFYDDLDNAERVAEEMHLLTEGMNLGWPYTYFDPIKKARMMAPEYGGDNRKRPEPNPYPNPVIAFPAHWAPLQMKVYEATQFPEKYRGGFFVAFHGSWNRAPRPQEGYNLTFVPTDAKGAPTGKYEVFASNFSGQQNLGSSRQAKYRPGGVAIGPDGSVFVSDTDKGRIWRIIYTGETAPAPTATATNDSAPAAPAATAAVNSRGKELYAQQCAICHMADGNGVPPLQPPLVGSAVVKGDPQLLINVILKGPIAVLPADRAKYSNIMPPYAMLTDAQVADLTTYLRQAYGGNASAITPAQVAAARASKP